MDLDFSKSLRIALIKILGVNKYLADYISCKAGLNGSVRTSLLSETQFNKLIKIIEGLDLLVKDNLVAFKKEAITKLIKINSYRGFRHSKGYPVRGQRTRTNASINRKKKHIYK